MSNRNFDLLLSAAIRNGGLGQEQIAQILDFKVFGNPQGFLRLQGMEIGDIPPTPQSRADVHKPDERSEKLLLQATALLGDPIGYVQESGGCIVNNLFPQPTQSRAASSDSFDTELDLHTENAFHAIQPDYLLLLCLRQDPTAQAITYIASVDRILEHLSYEQQAFFLNEPYNFFSDYGPTEKNQRIDINKHQTVLYGDPDAPFFRFDPQFMVAYSDRAQHSLDALRRIAWDVVEPVRLARSDLLIIDNRRTAHARSPFPARFDGSDRWMQRTFASCNLAFYTEKLGRQSRIFELVTEL
ncbi:iron hydroxylase [Pseudomonas sp. MTM4]|uniref:TauD/TfdA family dioxygenase n=1 Tax=unclassified Pseudomonas TaxID=196821 RepID=UPI0018D239AB|nr:MULTISPECIES: TauD/TfdA family dioxygenase [unclassified Pseudomonas]MBC8649033.1 iron hydroxylase [Pseudomonas sp. MT4]QXY92993.1 iron hydroxylase [Pseudomonas sp. MTM4]